MNEEDLVGRTFSDSWHRVAQVRVALRSTVRAHRQMYRGREWVVLRDTLSSDWFRISGQAWSFVSRLSIRRTVDEAWVESVAADPDHALSQEEVVQLLGQLNLSNLLSFDRAGAGHPRTGRRGHACAIFRAGAGVFTGSGRGGIRLPIFSAGCRRRCGIYLGAGCGPRRAAPDRGAGQPSQPPDRCLAPCQVLVQPRHAVPPQHPDQQGGEAEAAHASAAPAT